MNGVQIIQVIERYDTTWGWGPELWIGVGIFLIGIVMLVLFLIFDLSEISAIPIVITVVSFIAVLAFASEHKEIRLPPHYQVILDDSVSMTEFMQRYEVIEQRGTSYIVEERAEQ